MIQAFFKKNWIHFAVFAAIFIIAAAYFKPQLDGYGLKQHDVEQWRGASHETDRYREISGKEPLWTGTVFGGMPATQISTVYTGNHIKKISNFYFKHVPNPLGLLLLHLIGFYILALFLRINPIVGLIGAIAFSFASYEIIIIQAGHLTKSMATAFLPAVLGAFIYAYRTNRIWGILLSGLFMAFELAMNHVQVTYYFIFILLFLGVYFLYDAVVKKQLKSFFITSAGLIGIYLLAFAINYGNIALTTDYAKSTIRGGNDININPDGSSAKNQSAGLDRDYITQWSYGIGETFTLLSPNVKGGGSFAIGGSQFEPILENAELGMEEKNQLKNYPAYWGEQPFTSGPVYIGAVVLLLAFLGLIFLKGKMKWFLFAVTLLAIALSWGKNYMGLTNFFIDHIPGYNKFRTVTIILVLVELIVPFLGVLFLDQLIKNREEIQAKKKQLLIGVTAFFVFVFLIKIIGLGDGYTSQGDQDQMANVESGILNQIKGMDPAVLMSQYQLDVNNPQQLNEFVSKQAEPYYKNFESLKVVREAIYNDSMNRTLLFIFFAGLLVLVFIYTQIPVVVLTGGMLLLTMMDVIPVAYQYLGAQENGNKLKYWEEIGIATYPISSSAADEQILKNEIMKNPSLQAVVDRGEREGKMKADELGFTGQAKRNVIDAYRFSALGFATNYRVFDLNGGFSSNRASYLHKSLGGYHGAKLRNINNLYDFHLSKMTNKVYDMLNVQYFMQKDEQGVEFANPNATALGNVWFVSKIATYATPNDEIRALGNQFDIENIGQGQLIVNGSNASRATVYGSEKIQYVFGQKDTLSVPMSNGLQQGMEAVMVMDANGKTNLVPLSTLELDTAKSFLSLVKMKVVHEFQPKTEAVMLKSEAAKLKKQQFSGEGNIAMKSYAPNALKYVSNSNEDQFAVFSELYYPNGWKAFVDGKEVEIRKVNYLLRGIEIPKGKHQVEMIFDLPKYHTANTIASISSILLLLSIGGMLVYSIKKSYSQV